MIENIENCYGCSACAIACPYKAIEIKRNVDGFIKPLVDQKKCVNCGICNRVCPYVGANVLEIKKGLCLIGTYTGQSKNSSSGAIAYAIAEEALNKGEKVCGVEYNTNNIGAEHIVIATCDELYKISGSKYLQSNPYKGLRNILKENKGVIFGTPCQIAGVRNILNLNKNKRFILVDIFCHGVPSQLLWINHLKWLKNRYNVNEHASVSFRQKEEFIIKVGNYNGKAQVDPFYHMYLNKCVYAEACYKCPFRRMSAADIRLGDYFLDKKNPKSVVIVLSNEGKVTIDKLIDKNKVLLCNAFYSDVDKVQDAEADVPIPETREMHLNLLRKGIPPVKIMGTYRVILQYIKGFVKGILRLNR